MPASASLVQPPAVRSAAPDGPVEPPKRDGRRTHIVDRALDYVALADDGYTAARIAKKRRRSQGYVSIALRLGRAIAGMEPAELVALRSPRITWKLAQRIVREDADVVVIRQQLRAALGGFSSHNLDGRKHRKGRRAAAGAAGRPVGEPWGWDAAWFARDPVGFAEAHLRYLAGVQRSVQQQVARADARGGVRVPVGQGLRTLQRSLARAASRAGSESPAAPLAPDAPAEQHAVAVLEILDRKLAEAGREVAALLAARAVGAEPGATPGATPGAGARSGWTLPPLRGARARLSLAAVRDASVLDALEAELDD